MELLPRDEKQYLRRIARETARTSFPGRMQKILKDGTKKKVEKYFVDKFPLRRLWNNASKISVEFDDWHKRNVRDLANILKYQIKRMRKEKVYETEAIAAKLFNTFLHQLMKYDRCRPLWNKLHLPLDRRIFNNIWKLREEYDFFSEMKDLSEYKSKPYSYRYKEYKHIQDTLLGLIKEINRKQGYHKFTSRIELNAILWADK